MKLAHLALVPLLLGLAHSASAQLESAAIIEGPVGLPTGFGYGVGLSGDRLIVGAPDHGLGGRASIYERQGGIWTGVVDFWPPSIGSEPLMFGLRVAIDGPLAAVAAPRDDMTGTDGAVFLYARNAGGGWNHLADITTTAGGEFGRALAVDNGRVLIGAPLWDYPEFTNRGAAWVLDPLPGGGYDAQTMVQLVASDPEPNAIFGDAVALDGDRALIAAPYDPLVVDIPNAGSVYVRERQPDTSWSEAAKLTAPQPKPFDWFGQAVALDGDRALVGAPGDDDAGNRAGAVYVFERSPSGVWSIVDKWTASDAKPIDGFGAHLALDGDRAIIHSSSDNDGVLGGSVYCFLREGGAWRQAAKLVAPDESGPYEEFGFGLALDGARAAIGVPHDDTVGPIYAGSVRVHDLSELGQDLLATPDDISLSGGGTQELHQFAGPVFANRPFLMLGSGSGTTPGLPIGPGLTIPLNVDAYLLWVLANPGVAPLVGGASLLDATGQGVVSFTLPPGLPAALAGLIVNHAYVVFPSPTSTLVDHASRAVSVRLVP